MPIPWHDSGIRVIAVLLAWAGLLLPQVLLAGEPPVPATRLNLKADVPLSEAVRAIQQQSGQKLDVRGIDPTKPTGSAQTGVPFWTGLETLASAVGGRVETGNQGREIRLVPLQAHTPPAPSSVDEAFRTVVRSLNARRDFDTGRTHYEIGLDLHWEPRFPVVRIDSEPRIALIQNDRGEKITVTTAGVKSPVSGYQHSATVRVEGISRQAREIAQLNGEFSVTASPRMLTFTFDDLKARPGLSQSIDGVTVELASLQPRDDRWDLQLKLNYPATHPNFESFESWTGRNTVKLISPDRKRVVRESSFDMLESGRTAVATYRFFSQSADRPSDLRGWILLYDTPAPLREFPVKFAFQKLALP